jgi:Fe-S-cluster-containing hydrogenase components 2
VAAVVFPGCKGFADACVKADSLEGLLCPVGGSSVMGKVASILGKEAVESDPKVAVVRCNGTCSARPKTSNYDGTKSCAVAANTFAGETGCSFGCLGFGDCEVACTFDAIHIDKETGLPVVDEEKCTACGSCVKACPKFIIELRAKGKNNRRVFVSCVNKDKGAVARKACSNACIGCGKCAKECPFDAITVENNIAYIDFNKCKLCRKCVDVCPTGAIHAINFPPRKPKPAEIANDNVAAPKVAVPEPVKAPENDNTEATKA